jgi:peptide-methionine (S)-S-oxide reductase
MWSKKLLSIPSKDEAMPGRAERMSVAGKHFVNGHQLEPPFSDGLERAMFAMGCFWGAERKFWVLNGVYSTAVGYAAGHTPNPTYREVCTGMTGHTEAVLVVFDPKVIRYEDLLQTFWESHDPTQGMRQGNDVGTQYRSGIYYYSDAQRDAAETSRDAYQARLKRRGSARLRLKFSKRPSSITPRTITSSILRRIPAATAGWAAQASAVRLGSPLKRASFRLSFLQFFVNYLDVGFEPRGLHGVSFVLRRNRPASSDLVDRLASLHRSCTASRNSRLKSVFLEVVHRHLVL